MQLHTSTEIASNKSTAPDPSSAIFADLILSSYFSFPTNMAVSVGKLACCLFVLSFVILLLTQAEGFSGTAAAPAPSAPKIDCGVACDGRCAKSKRPNLCKRSCGSCCNRCNCVPPGTAGHHDACPCYATLKSRNGTPKQCP